MIGNAKTSPRQFDHGVRIARNHFEQYAGGAFGRALAIFPARQCAVGKAEGTRESGLCHAAALADFCHVNGAWNLHPVFPYPRHRLASGMGGGFACALHDFICNFTRHKNTPPVLHRFFHYQHGQSGIYGTRPFPP